MSAEMNCRVCGLPQLSPPWGESADAPSYDICDCCGVEFGYEDITPEAARRFRERWIEAGLRWFAPDKRPPDWTWAYSADGFEFATFTLEPADTSLSESTRLHADPSTLRPGSLGPSTGDLWLTLGGAAFPGARWNDFIVVILGAWCAAVLRVVRTRSRTEQVHFMEGPYFVELSRAGQGELHVRAMQRPGGRDRSRCGFYFGARDQPARGVGPTVEAARRLGDTGRDAVRLEHALVELQAAQVGLGGGGR